MSLKSKDANVLGLESHLLSEDQRNRPDHNLQFYEEYKKIFATSYYLGEQIRQLVASKQQLWKKLIHFEKRAEEEFKDQMRKEGPERKKRFRRTANDIEKKYVCEVERCQRNYGSEGSLIQHLKLKHHEYYLAHLQKQGAQGSQQESIHEQSDDN